ncbi:hypothetical protein NDU88_009225 [Pleurodeles waltl]|uniref:Uncharacterized protein n=1 Tax=Pleurodeles waltl TaxID=8319 RepID=A0AAV7QS20_PLEWA|nr:hypothetical protein NDU88_009225 [Pleurodeles waltl]
MPDTPTSDAAAVNGLRKEKLSSTAVKKMSDQCSRRKAFIVKFVKISVCCHGSGVLSGVMRLQKSRNGDTKTGKTHCGFYVLSYLLSKATKVERGQLRTANVPDP